MAVGSVGQRGRVLEVLNEELSSKTILTLNDVKPETGPADPAALLKGAMS